MGDSTEYVSHVDTDSDWAGGGLIGFLLSKKGLLGTVLLEVAASGAIWKLFNPTALVVAIPVCAALTFCLLVTRRYRVKSLKAHERLHDLCHLLRDELSVLLNDLFEDIVLGRMANFSDNVAEHVANYFRQVTGEATVNCLIRLAVQGDDDRVQYVTFGRSTGLDKSRSAKSEPIFESEGLPRAFHEKKLHGVYIIRDIAKAVEVGIWKRTRTDGLADVSRVMVAPMNSLDGDNNRTMIGLLSVTSKNVSFRKGDTLPMKACADLLALMYGAAMFAHELEANAEDVDNQESAVERS